MKSNMSKSAGFHTALQRARIEAEITQVELARRTGISQPRIAVLEAGAAKPSRQTAEKIAVALGLKPEKVFPDFATLREANRVARARP